MKPPTTLYFYVDILLIEYNAVSHAFVIFNVSSPCLSSHKDKSKRQGTSASSLCLQLHCWHHIFVCCCLRSRRKSPTWFCKHKVVVAVCLDLIHRWPKKKQTSHHHFEKGPRPNFACCFFFFFWQVFKRLTHPEAKVTNYLPCSTTTQQDYHIYTHKLLKYLVTISLRTHFHSDLLPPGLGTQWGEF